MFVRLSAVALGLLLASCEQATAPDPDPDPGSVDAEQPYQDDLVFEALGWPEIPGWPDLDAGPAMQALQRSCEAIEQLPADRLLSERSAVSGTVGDWQTVCRARLESNARNFLESNFVPVRVRSASATTGLLTGYYEPQLDVRREPDAEFSHPIRARPADLLVADLGAFSDDLAGQRVMGRVEGNRFVPYRSRQQIELAESGEPLAWGRPIDVFFLQIQGSGRLVFEDGETVRAAFAAHNGLPYASIGRELVARGELELHQASKAGIEAWLEANGPEATAELFAVNRRYIFFGVEPLADPESGPRGGSGLPLTPMGSIAIDPSFLPYGVPVILSADLPEAPGWHGILVTQDTGGAITGPMRGDLFYGWGEMAERRAGSTRSQAEWIILLPHSVAEHLLTPA